MTPFETSETVSPCHPLAMRLLNARTLEFEWFEDEDLVPRYAILSHTWGANEPTYRDMHKYRLLVKSRQKFEKIWRCAILALRDGVEYFWVDTCCIDKTSSAELSEAINSMFRWYKKAHVCYVYMDDAPATPVDTSWEASESWIEKFKASRWFTRGWTLQELIAPSRLIFLSQDWITIGTKHGLYNEIEAATNIPKDVLRTGDFEHASIAQRMSWAANRSTTRKEDVAYSLMGLFDVYMPMLYGEGERAFLRLQEEIIKRSDDMSIFGWIDPLGSFSSYRGLLARSPREFSHCKNMVWKRSMEGSSSFEMTNVGLRLTSVLRLSNRAAGEHLMELIGVKTEGDSEPQNPIAIYVQRVGVDQYARVATNELAPVDHGEGDDGPGSMAQTVLVRQKIILDEPSHLRSAGILVDETASAELKVIRVEPEDDWTTQFGFFNFEPAPALKSPPKVVFTILFKPTGTEFSITIDMMQAWGSSSFIEASTGTGDITIRDPECFKVEYTEILAMSVQVSLEYRLVSGTGVIMMRVCRSEKKKVRFGEDHLVIGVSDDQEEPEAPAAGFPVAMA